VLRPLFQKQAMNQGKMVFLQIIDFASFQPSENAVKTQVWIAIATFIPLVIAKKQLKTTN